MAKTLTTGRKIQIFADNAWAGDGKLINGTIEDCAAILGGSQDAADDAYAAIEEAIEAGEASVTVDDVEYTWQVTPPLSTRVVRLHGGDLGGEVMLVRCNLTEASSPVEVDYCEGDGWVSTQYQCADTSHRLSGLLDIGKILAARAVEMPADEFDCEHTEI